ncbi:hypothetical protein ACFLXK_04390 [Chloroflexota bacterium]
MSYQAREQQIIKRLKTIDQVHFEKMVNNLLYQGAFPEITYEGVVLGQFGTNIEKNRTIKSSPKADAEVNSQGLKIESSVEVDWRGKLKQVVQKNKSKPVRKFAFFTNQDVGTKQIKVDGKETNAEDYSTGELECEQSYLVGQKDLLLAMQDPNYFSIRRNYLGLDDDFFCSVTEYDEILKRPSLRCDTDKLDLQRYGVMLKNALPFDYSRIVILHNDDYISLLHTISVWANLIREDSHDIDVCFIKYPYKNVDIASVDGNEIDKTILTVIVVWGANEIDNISDFLRFTAENVMVVLVTPTAFREEVLSRLKTFKGNIRIEEISIEAIDTRQVSREDKEKHQEKIKTVVSELLDLMLRYEALVYFYSPVNLDDEQKTNNIMTILEIDHAKLEQLRELLIKSDLAAITGRILWLKQPNVAKELLNDFITKDAISISSLAMGI